MRIKVLVASFITLLSHNLAAATPSPPPLPMAPAGPWKVEFADSMCLLSRPYGKESATNLILKPGMIGDDLEIIVTTASSSIANPGYGKAVIAIAGEGTINDAHFNAYSIAKARLLRIHLGDEKIALAAMRGTLSVDAGRESRHLFSLAGIERALPILSECLAQLRAIYKVSPTDLAAIVTAPKGNVVGFFKTEDYPAEALQNEETGSVGVLLWVETDGRISSCQVIESSGSPALERTTCSVIQRRARVTPATGLGGKAVRAPMFYRVRWELPS